MQSFSMEAQIKILIRRQQMLFFSPQNYKVFSIAFVYNGIMTSVGTGYRWVLGRYSYLTRNTLPGSG
jgi:hypothetical protein